MSFKVPEDDNDRVEFIHSLNILDTSRDENLDRIVDITSLVFSAPISVISIVDQDRQWFKSLHGIDITETSRDTAFCSHTVAARKNFEVLDALNDEEFSKNPLVLGKPHIRYYFGAPIKIQEYVIGSLCILDDKPRDPLSQDQRNIMKNLAAMVSREIELQRLLRESIPIIVAAAQRATPNLDQITRLD